ncbi:MAG: hypothetical protein H6980_06085 [Gammaproteobacteria bacterium]|nr:hypothetical protein [Gammaproteobacteria bacterium]
MPEQTDLTPADTPPPAGGVTRFICWPGRRRADGGRDTPRLVCLSSRESYVANVPSLLGIAEVIGAVWLYWWAIPAWFDTHWHLLVSVLIAPLLLLRSPASIEAALDNFWRYWRNNHREIFRSPKGRLCIATSLLVAQGVAFLIATRWLSELQGLTMFWWSGAYGLVAINISIAALAAIVGNDLRVGDVIWVVVVAGAGAVVTAFSSAGAAALSGTTTAVIAIAIAVVSTKVGAVALILIGLGFIIGQLARATSIKVFATLNHPLTGARQLQDNWRRLVFAQDFHRPPEILPGINHRPGFFELDTTSLFRDLKSGDAVNRTGAALSTLMVVAPAWFYRLSLKSTFWFYWPLVFAQARVRGIGISAKTLVKEHSSTLAGLPLALFAATLVISPLTPVWTWLGQFTVLVGIKAEHLNLVALLGEKALLVWPAALVSLLLYVSANLLGPRADNAEISAAQIGWLKALIGARWALVWSALLTGLLLFASEAAREWTPLAILEFSTWLRTHYFGLFPAH